MNVISYLSKSENNLALLFCSAILSMTVPYGFPLFGVLVLLFVSLKLITKNIKLRLNTGFVLFYSSIFFYMLGMFWSNGIVYSRNVSEIINIISFLLIWLLLSDLHRNQYKTLINNIAKYTIILCFPISIFSLYKFSSLLNGNYFTFLYFEEVYPTGSSLVIDYNMFCLGMFAGAIMSLYQLNFIKNHKIFFLVSFFACSASIFFAGSRRGWIILLVLMLFAAILLFKYIFKNIRNLTKLFKIAFVGSYLAVFSLLLIHFIDSNFDTNILKSQEIEKLQWRFESIQLTNLDSSFSDRTIRWEYGNELINEYEFFELFFGSGFDYLPKFADKFNVTSTSEDYPHNPFISATLYSGIIGLILIILMFAWAAVRFLKNRGIIGTHLIFYYLIIWMFVFISGNSIFTNKLFILVTLIILSIPKKNETKTIPSTIGT